MVSAVTKNVDSIAPCSVAAAAVPSRPPGAAEAQPRTLVEQLLAEQRQLTAVEEFSRVHDEQRITSSHYRSFIPLVAPAAGEQLAFEVDLDRCSGCKACVTACHSLNGLDDGEVWRDVGMLISDDWRRPFQQVVTTACHHCVDPGCLNGCPVLAYEKDPSTGIVRHLDDQCIGCQYCILKCPYDVPKYSEARGIVRKCDMCAQRLASGEAPACVQGCPNEAIRITLVDQAAVSTAFRTESGSSPAVRRRVGGSEGRRDHWNLSSFLKLGASPAPFLPASPDPALTLPTTRYISARELSADLIPSNAPSVSLQCPHWPLILMLVLTQLAVGAFTLLPIWNLSSFLQFGASPHAPSAGQQTLAITATAATLVGLLASVLHLGRPLKAWRAFLGLQRSWLSREIMTLSVFASLAVICALAGEQPPLWLVWLAALTGWCAVFCSAKVYDDTPRPFWRGIRSFGKFFGTAAVLGLALTWCVTPLFWIPIALAIATAAKLAGEHRLLRRAEGDLAEQVWAKDGDCFNWSLAQSARLMRDELGHITRTRFFCGVAGGVVLPLLSLLPVEVGVGGGAPALPNAPVAAALAVSALALSLAGEVMERYTFFRAVVPPRMPGNA